jgi:hypothetical protein
VEHPLALVDTSARTPLSINDLKIEGAECSPGSRSTLKSTRIQADESWSQQLCHSSFKIW